MLLPSWRRMGEPCPLLPDFVRFEYSLESTRRLGAIVPEPC